VTAVQENRMARRAQRAFDDGDVAKAERLFTAALQTHPDHFDALHGLGLINYRRGRLDAALSLVQAALQADLDRADGFSTLGLVFLALREFERALKSFDAGLRIAPDDAELLNRRGVALLELGRPHDALACFDRVLVAAQNHLEALGNRGNALLKLNRAAEALASYERALTLVPDNAELLTNRAAVLRKLDRPHEAVMSARSALVSRPDFAQAKFVEALTRLTLGDFSGWRGYETRWSVGFLAGCRRQFAAPLWLGEQSLSGKTILLYAEQGFGDTLQFVRYAPLVAARGAKVVLEVQQALKRLLAPTPGVAAVIGHGETLPALDFQCPLLSLPLALGTELSTIPAGIPYVAPPDEDVASWRQRLPARKPLVGLVWSGERSHDNDLNRSLRLETLAPLFSLSNVTFVSLQHEVREVDAGFLRNHPAIAHIGDRFRDFADTAAAIAQLDAVIAADTAVAHLAGAMGKPLLLLLPFGADFRWLRERSDSPWYPTAKLYRQPAFGDWASVIATLRQDLPRADFVPHAEKLSA
jgi:tetratricopeptide (TPR) repeat protein